MQLSICGAISRKSSLLLLFFFQFTIAFQSFGGYELGALALDSLDKWHDVISSNIASQAPGSKQVILAKDATRGEAIASYTTTSLTAFSDIVVRAQEIAASSDNLTNVAKHASYEIEADDLIKQALNAVNSKYLDDPPVCRN